MAKKYVSPAAKYGFKGRGAQIFTNIFNLYAQNETNRILKSGSTNLSAARRAGIAYANKAATQGYNSIVHNTNVRLGLAKRKTNRTIKVKEVSYVKKVAGFTRKPAKNSISKRIIKVGASSRLY